MSLMSKPRAATSVATKIVRRVVGLTQPLHLTDSFARLLDRMVHSINLGFEVARPACYWVLVGINTDMLKIPGNTPARHAGRGGRNESRSPIYPRQSWPTQRLFSSLTNLSKFLLYLQCFLTGHGTYQMWMGTGGKQSNRLSLEREDEEGGEDEDQFGTQPIIYGKPWPAG